MSHDTTGKKGIKKKTYFIVLKLTLSLIFMCWINTSWVFYKDITFNTYVYIIIIGNYNMVFILFVNLFYFTEHPRSSFKYYYYYLTVSNWNFVGLKDLTTSLYDPTYWSTIKGQSLRFWKHIQSWRWKMRWTTWDATPLR